MSRSLEVGTTAAKQLVDSDAVLSVGRDTSSDFRFDDERVSRRHGRIQRRENRWTYEDLDSTNGSFVDGRRVRELFIESGVSLRLGDPVDGPVLTLAIVDAHPTHAEPVSPHLHTLAELTRIGRALDNDIVVDDLIVSRHHAEIRRAQNGTTTVRDLGSFNGTYLNGNRISEERLVEGDELAIGARIFRLAMGHLHEGMDELRVTLQAKDLVVTLRGGRRLLDGVSFALPDCSMLAVVGPTGAGKSTLMNALAGFRPADSGTLLYAGRDFYANYATLSARIGYVPQQDIIHLDLNARAALRFAAELRFPQDTKRSEREQRVEEVLTELGLLVHSTVPIRSLSGGQRKRASVGLELLTRPSLLLLDEPTSGLDPGYEREMMVLLRQLASRGRTVVLVTHSVQSLDVCDRILFLAAGGKQAFFGPPRDALRFFGKADYASVFRYLEAGRDVDWASRYALSPWRQDLVVATLRAAPRDGLRPQHMSPAGRALPDPMRQFSILTRRYVRVLATDQRNLVFLLAQGPLIGLLLLVATQTDRLVPGHQGANLLVLTLVVSGTFIGAANSIREIVKEKPIVDRERAWGQSMLSYLGSKVVVLGLIAAVQSLVLVPLAAVRHGGPTSGIVLPWPLLELSADVALTALSAMAVGLLISAVVKSADLALTLLPIVLVSQLVLTGALFPFRDSPGIRELSYLASARWGYVATAATAGVRDLEQCDALEAQGHAPALCEVAGERDVGSWAGGTIGLVGIFVSALALTAYRLTQRRAGD